MRVTSILLKVLMAITGLAWFGCAITHLTANFLILKGPDALNGYAEGLAKFGPLLWVAEAGLVLLLLVHVGSAFRVTRMSKLARPQGYVVSQTRGEATLGSRTMAIGGVILLAFLIIHVKMFKFGDWSGANGLHGLVVRSFKNPLIVGGYVLAMLAFGLHLSHGVASAFQSLGILKPSWRPRLKEIGFFIGWAIAFGFAALPIATFFFV